MNNHLQNIQQSLKNFNKEELQQFCAGTVELLGNYFKILEQEFPEIKNTKEIQKTIDIIFEEFLSRLPSEKIHTKFSPENIEEVKSIAKECFGEFLISVDFSEEESYEVAGVKENVVKITYKGISPEEVYPRYQEFLKRTMDMPSFTITFSRKH